MSGLTFEDNLHIYNKRGDNYINFQVARQDNGSVANKQFNAWLSNQGSYVIMERDLTDPNDITNKYYIGKTIGDFEADWIDRAGLDYMEYNALFT